jgi:hypothetical protein
VKFHPHPHLYPPPQGGGDKMSQSPRKGEEAKDELILPSKGEEAKDELILPSRGKAKEYLSIPQRGGSRKNYKLKTIKLSVLYIYSLFLEI